MAGHFFAATLLAAATTLGWLNYGHAAFPSTDFKASMQLRLPYKPCSNKVPGRIVADLSEVPFYPYSPSQTLEFYLIFNKAPSIEVAGVMQDVPSDDICNIYGNYGNWARSHMKISKLTQTTRVGPLIYCSYEPVKRNLTIVLDRIAGQGAQPFYWLFEILPNTFFDASQSPPVALEPLSAFIFEDRKQSDTSQAPHFATSDISYELNSLSFPRPNVYSPTIDKNAVLSDPLTTQAESATFAEPTGQRLVLQMPEFRLAGTYNVKIPPSLAVVDSKDPYQYQAFVDAKDAEVRLVKKEAQVRVNTEAIATYYEVIEAAGADPPKSGRYHNCSRLAARNAPCPYCPYLLHYLLRDETSPRTVVSPLPQSVTVDNGLTASLWLNGQVAKAIAVSQEMNTTEGPYTLSSTGLDTSQSKWIEQLWNYKLLVDDATGYWVSRDSAYFGQSCSSANVSDESFVSQDEDTFCGQLFGSCVGQQMSEMAKDFATRDAFGELRLSAPVAEEGIYRVQLDTANQLQFIPSQLPWQPSLAMPELKLKEPFVLAGRAVWENGGPKEVTENDPLCTSLHSPAQDPLTPRQLTVHVNVTNWGETGGSFLVWMECAEPLESGNRQSTFVAEQTHATVAVQLSAPEVLTATVPCTLHFSVSAQQRWSNLGKTAICPITIETCEGVFVLPQDRTPPVIEVKHEGEYWENGSEKTETTGSATIVQTLTLTNTENRLWVYHVTTSPASACQIDTGSVDTVASTVVTVAGLGSEGINVVLYPDREQAQTCTVKVFERRHPQCNVTESSALYSGTIFIPVYVPPPSPHPTASVPDSADPSGTGSGGNDLVGRAGEGLGYTQSESSSGSIFLGVFLSLFLLILLFIVILYILVRYGRLHNKYIERVVDVERRYTARMFNKSEPLPRPPPTPKGRPVKNITALDINGTECATPAPPVPVHESSEGLEAFLATGPKGEYRDLRHFEVTTEGQPCVLNSHSTAATVTGSLVDESGAEQMIYLNEVQELYYDADNDVLWLESPQFMYRLSEPQAAYQALYDECVAKLKLAMGLHEVACEAG